MAGHKGFATLSDGVGSVKGDHERRNGLARSLLASKDLFLSLDQGSLVNPAVDSGSTNQPEVGCSNHPGTNRHSPSARFRYHTAEANRCGASLHNAMVILNQCCCEVVPETGQRHLRGRRQKVTQKLQYPV